MPLTVNMHDAKTSLSRLVKLVENGEEVIIARDGKPAARLCRVELMGKRKLPFGLFRDKLKMLPGFDDIPEEMKDYV